LILFAFDPRRRAGLSHPVIPTGEDHREGDDLRSGGTLCLVQAEPPESLVIPCRHCKD
jgi:hypothetical protein